jgi:5-methyltetrahydropteroyltriglutamate--homocysteine methyltransferase
VTRIASYQHGLYPRSEALIAATRDADRGRGTIAAVEDERTSDAVAFESLQREAGLDFVSSGFLSWKDIFRPLVDACHGLVAGPLTRWFDNNVFFRAPVVTGPLDFKREAFAADGGQVGLLPGPHTFACLTSAQADHGVLIDELTRQVLRPAAEELVGRGARVLHLQEPSLVVHGIDDADWPHLTRALRLLRDGLDVRLVLHTYFGDAAPRLDQLRALPVDAIGVDLTATDLAALAGPWRVGLLAGCLDGRSSVIEDVAGTVALGRQVLEVAQPPWLILSSGCDLDLLPRAIADEKVRVLGAAARTLREES